MYLMQTVSTAPRSRLPQQEAEPLSMEHPGPYPPIGRRNRIQHEPKKKEKKWSLGGLFRRRKKDAAGSDTSSQEDDDEDSPARRKSGGFLSRRRSSRRDKARKQRTTFDHVVVNPLTQTLKPKEQINGNKEVDRSPRQDSSVSRNSSSSMDQSTSGAGTGARRSKRYAVKARVEAMRDRQRAESSSEEGEPNSTSAGSPVSRYRSDESLPLQREGSLSRRSRMARTERYIRRLSREEEGVLRREAAELELQRQQRVSKSDAEAGFGLSPGSRRRVGASGRWMMYQDSGEPEPVRFVRGSSATPSPAQSPLVRRKYTNPDPSTFPPGHSIHYAMPIATSSLDRKGPTQYARVRGPSPSNRSADSVPIVGIPRARIDGYRHARQNLDPGSIDQRQSKPQQQQRSLSYDSNIHRVPPGYSPEHDPNDVMIVQFPVARLPGFTSSRHGAPLPPPRDPQRRFICAPSVGQQERPMSFAFDANAQSEFIGATIGSIPHSRIQGDVSNETSWVMGSQRRSNSDNQLATQHFGSHILRPHAYNPMNRPRPSSVTPEATKHLIQQCKKPYDQQFHYFADQQPRSRRPIHIQCNAGAVPASDQPYLSDSQVVVMKPPYQRLGWRQDGSIGRSKKTVTSPKLSLHQPAVNERSRSSSPRPSGLSPHPESAKTCKMKVPPLSLPSVRNADSLSSLSGHSDMSSPMQGNHSSKISPDVIEPSESAALHRPLSMVLEKTETPEHTPQVENVSNSLTVEEGKQNSIKNTPPIPPARRYSRQSSTSSTGDMSEDMGKGNGAKQKKRSSTNLEDALNELEAIYKSLKLGDEDLLDRAERRDLPTPHQKLAEPNSPSRGTESDSGYNYSWGSSSYESLFDSPPPRRQRTPGYRRSGIPDRVADDMAFRRMCRKERPGSQDIRNVMSQAGSYLATSPAAAAAEISPEDIPQKPLYAPVNHEPDVTLDDVVFRTIRHANNTLKVLDPQPPFGIPLGPIAPAPNSDYLHITPTDTHRPTFKPRKIPDVVKDDLAYRNLRKDTQKENLPQVNEDFYNNYSHVQLHPLNENFSLRKKRAVRSLSANIQSLVHREPLSIALRDGDQEFEKAQSLTDLPDALQVAQKILEGKDVIGGGSVRIRDLTASNSQNDKEGTPVRRYSPGASWVERANLMDCGERSSFLASTSTETLTDSRANLIQQDSKRGSWQQRLKVFIPPSAPNSAEENERDKCDNETVIQRPPPPPTPERTSSRVFCDQVKQETIVKPPPTPERSSSRRPSLDQNKILTGFTPLSPSPSTLEKEDKAIRPPTLRITSPVASNQKTSDSFVHVKQVVTPNSMPKDETLPLPEVVPGSPIDERQLDELLTALAREARATSERLGREINELEHSPEKDGNVQTQTPIPHPSRTSSLSKQDKCAKLTISTTVETSRAETSVATSPEELEQKEANVLSGRRLKQESKQLQKSNEEHVEQEQAPCTVNTFESKNNNKLRDSKALDSAEKSVIQLSVASDVVNEAPESNQATLQERKQNKENCLREDNRVESSAIPPNKEHKSSSMERQQSISLSQSSQQKRDPLLEDAQTQTHSEEMQLQELPQSTPEEMNITEVELFIREPGDIVQPAQKESIQTEIHMSDKTNALCEGNTTLEAEKPENQNAESQESNFTVSSSVIVDTQIQQSVRDHPSSSQKSNIQQDMEVVVDFSQEALSVSESQLQVEMEQIIKSVLASVDMSDAEDFEAIVNETIEKDQKPMCNTEPVSENPLPATAVNLQEIAADITVEVEQNTVQKQETKVQQQEKVSVSDSVRVRHQPSAPASSSSASPGWYCAPVDPATVLVACSYCIACAHHLVAGVDFLTVIGILLAIVSVVAALIF